MKDIIKIAIVDLLLITIGIIIFWMFFTHTVSDFVRQHPGPSYPMGESK